MSRQRSKRKRGERMSEWNDFFFFLIKQGKQQQDEEEEVLEWEA